MSNSTTLSKEELQFVNMNEEAVLQVVARLENVKRFNLNDYLIAFRLDYEGVKRVPLMTSYKTPQKFKVVHVDNAGIPYVREVSSKGVIRGRLIPLLGGEDFRYDDEDMFWEHDPHFVESIIMDADGVYDPTEQQRVKKTRRDEITKHNAEYKLDCSNISLVDAHFDKMAVGETYWFSISGNMTITKTDKVKYTNAKNASKPKIGHYTQITVIEKGKTKVYTPNDFVNRNLYSKQPRSYKELSDSI